MKKILSESQKRKMLTETEQRIISSFSETFNKIKRLDESEVSELSHTTFHSAVNGMKDRNQNQRSEKLGQTYLHAFQGKPLFGGIIKSLSTTNPSHGDYNLLRIEVLVPSTDSGPDKIQWVEFDIAQDSLSFERDTMSRSDARMLMSIIKMVKPDSKYITNGAKMFPIDGYSQ